MDVSSSSFSDCQLHTAFAVNIGVGVMTRQYQNLTADDGEGATADFFHPQLMEVDGDVAQTGDRTELAGVSYCSCLWGELELWVAA